MKSITDRTVYNMAWDVCDGVTSLDMIKYANMPDGLKYDLVKKIIAPLRYVALLMEVHKGLREEVNLILLAKSPDVIDGWDKVRRTLLQEEERRRVADEFMQIDGVEQAAVILDEINKPWPTK